MIKDILLIHLFFATIKSKMHIKLNDYSNLGKHMNIPRFGLGTFRLKEQAVIDSVKNALDVGYRVIDTAQIYDNEAAIGQAIAERCITSGLIFNHKIWVDNFAQDKFIPSLKA